MTAIKEELPAVIAGKFKHVSVVFEEATEYMEKRKSGEIKSIKTPWESFNDAGMDGIEWNTMYVISARPGVGKTLVSQLITSNAHRLNSDQDFFVLHLQFEMLGRTLAQREISAKLNRTLKYLNSADKYNKLTPSDLEKAKEYAQKQKERKEYIYETPSTVEGIKRAVLEFLNYVKRPVIITLDHSMLVKKGADEKATIDMLQNLSAMMTEIKRAYPVIWLVLSQLNRSIEQQERITKPGIGNFPNTNDVFGADALLQHCDVLLAINQPSKYALQYYGPQEFEVHKELLAFHFLKVRSGDTRISFYNAEFEKMNIAEIAPPKTKK
jgi:replicative DNA helicase